MLVKEFAEQVAGIAKEVSCDGEGRIGSHKLPSRITVWNDDPNDDTDYELVGIEPSMLPGCMCWDGIILKIRKVSDKPSGDSHG